MARGSEISSNHHDVIRHDLARTAAAARALRARSAARLLALGFGRLKDGSVTSRMERGTSWYDRHTRTCVVRHAGIGEVTVGDHTNHSDSNGDVVDRCVDADAAHVGGSYWYRLYTE